MVVTRGQDTPKFVKKNLTESSSLENVHRYVLVKVKFHIRVGLLDGQGGPSNVDNISKSSSNFKVSNKCTCRKEILIWSSR